jgi:hypothetical protein
VSPPSPGSLRLPNFLKLIMTDIVMDIKLIIKYQRGLSSEYYDASVQ